MSDDFFSSRTKKIRKHLRKSGIACLILTSQANVTYTTGFLGDDSWAIITPTRTYLITDSRYTEQAQNECHNLCKIVEQKSSLVQKTSEIVNKLKNVEVAAVESSCAVAVFNQLRKKLDAKLKAVAGVIEQIRAVKEPNEVSCTKKAAAIAIKALNRALVKVAPGMTEGELAGQIELEIRKQGSTTSFDTIVAFGPNASMPHYKPGTRKLKKNDTILIDYGAIYQGYSSDITRCYVVGKPSKLFRKVFDTVLEAQAVAIKAVRAGVDITEVDSAARDVVRRSGLPVYGHGTGHGLGLVIHETPFLNPRNKAKLTAGQIITIEPGIYIPDKLGVRIEDDVLVTETGCKILTKSLTHSFLLPGK